MFLLFSVFLSLPVSASFARSRVRLFRVCFCMLVPRVPSYVRLICSSVRLPQVPFRALARTFVCVSCLRVCSTCSFAWARNQAARQNQAAESSCGPTLSQIGLPGGRVRNQATESGCGAHDISSRPTWK